MKLIFVSSLETHCRNAGVRHLLAHYPRAIVVRHDLLEGHRVLRRVEGGAPAERAETVLEHGCIGCAVRFEIMPTLLRLAPADPRGVLIMALPPTWHSDLVLDLVRPELQRRSLEVTSIALALDPASLEDQIWDRHTLWESGFNAMEQDERTAGEFLFREFMLADTVIPVEGLGAELLGDAVAEQRADGTGFAGGLALAAQMAPHAVFCRHQQPGQLGAHDKRLSTVRARPGHLPPAASGEAEHHGCSAIEVGAERPLHPGRLRDALPELAQSCACIRGTVWIASAPGVRIALGGAGPRVWMESTGPWGGETAMTQLMLVGSGHEPAEIQAVLHGCQLTDAELREPWPMSTPPEAGNWETNWEEVSDEGS